MAICQMPSDILYTTKQVADALNITTGRVRQIARALDLGRWVGSVRLYSEADVAAMRARKQRTPGRPAKEPRR